jgi:hypothetical protein
MGRVLAGQAQLGIKRKATVLFILAREAQKKDQGQKQSRWAPA